MATSRSIYQTALDVQNASNPNGVINTLANEILPAIRAEADYAKLGTAYVTHHPVLILFLDKLNSLTGLQSIGDAASYDRIHAAYEAVNTQLEIERAAAAGVPYCECCGIRGMCDCSTPEHEHMETGR